MRSYLVALAAVLVSTNACAQSEEWPRVESAPGAVAYIISPSNGEVVSSPFKVQFGLSGMGVAPAGIEYPDTGHHHLLVNRAPLAMHMPLPSGEADLLHFGGGQTEATLTLEPGQYTLQMILGDQDHVPHDPPVMSKIVTISVE
ncbi:MAG: DUF4399 domain-containing protein [Rhodospirillaceae bacterium]|jgi:hypothetical protein|nr:DUF4399 domain-containing protein [Rhodospirillaceae bacterium]